MCRTDYRTNCIQFVSLNFDVSCISFSFSIINAVPDLSDALKYTNFLKIDYNIVYRETKRIQSETTKSKTKNKTTTTTATNISLNGNDKE